MTVLSESQAREFAAILDGYEDMIATANAGKTDTLDDIRDVLRQAGLKGKDLADELANFRAGAADARLLRTNPEKAERKEKRRDGATDYLFLLTQKASCVHEGHLSVVAGTDFDPETGVITESSGEWERGVTSQSTSPLTQQGAATPDKPEMAGQSATLQSGSDSSACTRTEHPAPLDTHSELSHGASASSDEPAETSIKDVGGMQAVETVAEAISVASASQNPGDDHDQVNSSRNMPGQAKSTAGALPDRASRPIVPTMPPIPEFLRRANTSQTGRA